MFKPTPSLNARLEARLRGWRGPPTKILRDEKKRTDPLALAPAFGDALFNEPQRGLPLAKAHKMMGLPMDDILVKRGQRQTMEESDVVQISRIPRYKEPELDELHLGIAKQKQKSRGSHPYRPRRETRTVGDTQGLLPLVKIPRKPTLARYKPPSTSYWRHSIYTYNKHSSKDLAVTTANTNKLIRAYFNMQPSMQYKSLLGSGGGAGHDSFTGSTQESSATTRLEINPDGEVKEATTQMQEMAEKFAGMTHQQRLEYPIAGSHMSWRVSYKQQLAELYAEHDMSTEEGKKALNKLVRSHLGNIKRALKLHKTARDRVLVSDRGYDHKGMLRQDLLGKISQRMQPKSSFHYPFKELVAVQPQITYKHYRDGVGISVHVHEQQEDGQTFSTRNGSRPT